MAHFSEVLRFELQGLQGLYKGLQEAKGSGHDLWSSREHRRIVAFCVPSIEDYPRMPHHAGAPLPQLPADLRL